MIEAWVTGPAGESDYITHLERSKASPFRGFAFSVARREAGAGSLEYHLDNRIVAENPGLLAYGNVVWMRFRGRTRAWIIEERSIVLDEGEHETDWVEISGRGSRVLLDDRLVLPPAFANGTNLNPATWGKDNQWRRFVNRHAGEMLWDLISESNGRFATALVAGTIETDPDDGWTQDFRFDTIAEVVADVERTYGEVDLEGLTFSYRVSPGTDRSSAVIFEEGADLLKVGRRGSDRDTISWAVAEGVGEGVTAKLAIASDPAIARRREGYVDAKDAANLPLVQLRANAAIVENAPTDSIAVDVHESRYRLFEDFDVHDTVRVIAPSRGVDETAVIVAAYVKEVDDQVRVSIDINTPRQDELLRLEEGGRSTRRSVGIRNRQPQGQLVPYSFGNSGVFDTGSPMRTFVKIPDRVTLIIEALVTLSFREFQADSTGASSGGGSTSGASSTSTTGSSGDHSHGMFTWVDDTPGAVTSREFTTPGPGPGSITLATSVSGDIRTNGVDFQHTHGMAHTHTTPNHTHGLVYGTFEETYPGSHSVTLKVYERVAGSWTLRGTFAGLTGDLVDVDLTAVIVGPGDWRLTLQSDAAQPNGGRLGCDVYGAVTGAIQSA